METSTVRDAVVSCIETRDHPLMEERAKPVDQLGFLLEKFVRERLADEPVAVSLDGLHARWVDSDGEATLNITGAFYTLGGGWGKQTDQMMLPMHAQLSVEPGAVSIVRIAGLESQFEIPRSERQFQRAFDNASWRHSLELRLS